MFFTYKTTEFKCKIPFISSLECFKCVFRCKFLYISLTNNLKNYQIVINKVLDYIFSYFPRMSIKNNCLWFINNKEQ